MAISIAVLATLALGACGGGDDSSKDTANQGSPSSGGGEPVDLTFWTGFTQRELKVIKKVVGEFESAHPNIHVKVVGGIDDDKIIASIRGGNAPDVAHSFTSDNTGAFCPSGAWIDLAPYMQRDGISDDIFPEAPRNYTQFEGKRCALPMLADVYGLYYNQAMFDKAGLSGPPKTMSELMEYAKKLTVRNSDGSLKVVGIDPMDGFYENAAAHWGPSWGADWIDESGKSSFASDPGWAEMLQWQKELIDFYGHEDLVRWQAAAGDEFSPSNAFEREKAAMNLDGEWRVAFINDETPDLEYGTAPMPVDDDQPDLYGSGYTTGNIVGIPKTSEDQDEAWELLKYLTTDDHALAALANGILNVPTTKTSLESDELDLDPKFRVFLDIFAHPETRTTPITVAGSANQEIFDAFVTKYQSGKVDDLQGGLAEADEQVDAQLANAGGGDVP